MLALLTRDTCFSRSDSVLAMESFISFMRARTFERSFVISFSRAESESRREVSSLSLARLSSTSPGLSPPRFSAEAMSARHEEVRLIISVRRSLAAEMAAFSFARSSSALLAGSIMRSRSRSNSSPCFFSCSAAEAISSIALRQTAASSSEAAFLPETSADSRALLSIFSR